MKKCLCILLLAAMAALALPASAAYELNGTVVSAVTENVAAPYGGTVSQVPVRAGQIVRAGDTIAVLKTEKVYAKESGTVYLFGSVGDDAETLTEIYGGVAFLESDQLYSVSGSTKYAYDSEETKIVHPGETVYLRSVDGEAYGRGMVTTIADNTFEVLISSGDLSSGVSANIFRTANCIATQRLGRGTVARKTPAAYTATGIIVSYAVSSGQKVSKGDLLFETVSGSFRGDTTGFTLIRAPEDGIIAAVNVNPGDTVEQGAAAAVLYPLNAIRVEAAARESDLAGVHTGDRVYIEMLYYGMADQPLTGTVEYVSRIGAQSETEESEEASFSVFVAVDETAAERLACGMNVIITSVSQADADVSFAYPEENPEEEFPEDGE